MDGQQLKSDLELARNDWNDPYGFRGVSQAEEYIDLLEARIHELTVELMQCYHTLSDT